MLPFISLNAAAAPVDGAARDYERVLAHHTMRLVVTGEPDTLSVHLLGSHDGADWFPILLITGGTRLASTAGNGDHNVRYVKARLNALSGGTAPTVTATIAST
ncbi:hypothetical protein [Streptomyces sp. CC219B]|uniref:hypothetical protein n=1 Tax=Streptomyces sp. CC219B TaxID=3044574 RepID=UPI0024A9F3C9|nr:hypothetical protein [Streptomyces sp. CC219B]